jgi:PAS domain S-box-containing protein
MPMTRIRPEGGRPDTSADPMDGEVQRLRDLLQVVDAVVWEADAHSGGFTFVSPRVEDMFGYTVRECVLEPDFWADHIHPDDRERVVAVCRNAVAEGRDHELEYRVAAADGRTLWIQDTRRVIRDAAGCPTHVRGVLVDVTAHKATGAAQAGLVVELTRAQEQMAALLEIAKDICGTVDRDVILDRVQRRTAALLPCDRVVTYYWDSQTKAFRAIACYGLETELLEDALALEFHLGDPIINRLADGQTVVLNDAAAQGLVPPELLGRFGIRALIGVPLMTRGRILGAFVAASTQEGSGFVAGQAELLESIARQVAVAIETTALYQTQQQEAQISAALARVGQEMISSLDTPVLLERLCQLTTEALGCDCSHTLLWEPREQAFIPVSAYGYPPELWEAIRTVKLPPSLFGDSLAALDREEVRQLAAADLPNAPLVSLAAEMGITVSMGTALRRGREMIGFHVACYRGRQEPFTAQQERMARGIAQMASLALANARLVEELERAARLKSDFVATMSHELRTPLNVIVGYNALLLDRVYGNVNVEQRDILRRMERSAYELLELINATLDMSRLEAGRLPLDLHDVSLPDFFAEIDSETRGVRDKPGVHFTWRIHPQLPRIRTDPLKLKVVLKNLIGNAVKFTEQGRVTVSAQPRDSWLEFAVADTGIGIAQDAQEYIFEPFRQGDGSTTRRYGGVGLGLYIVRRLLDVLHGSISVDSQPGRGSTFRFAIPLITPEAES